MPQGRILIVEDDADHREMLRLFLEPLPVEIRVADGPEAAAKLLATERFHAVLCDLVMEGGGGLEVLRSIRNRDLPTPVIIVTGYGDGDVAEECLAAGAFDYVSKPVDRLSLIAVVRRALLRSGLIFEETLASPPEQPVRQFPFMVGKSQPMMEVLRRIAKVAEVDSNVCVYGESGTGKELVARAIHYSSPRADRPLIVFDCTAIPEGLMESELFGHVKGSFTSAISDREGVFQLADGGSLFIDEIGELSLPLQAKLLRVIQSREFRKVGGKHAIKADVRIIAATNKDLRAMVAEGTFREDLFYRLEVIPITIPPLRRHKEDIPLLVDFFIQRFNRNNTKQIQGISSRTMAVLLQYQWPGNVRELENCIERAAVMCDGKILDLEDLAPILRPAGGAAPLPASAKEGSWPRSLRESRKDAERELILKTLQSVSGNRTRAAELLGISLRALHYKLKDLPPSQIPPVSSKGDSNREDSGSGDV
ncbi:MAG TPA: sigma-54 dependent transcriptional regulator [Dissulfurispiraceae bacterium]|nr:sigma-54 dependent transcriptional regulator [Dissulfurispiraceae bacterium]